MSEPSFTVALSGALTAVTMDLLGIDAKPLMWAFIGSTVGLTFAAEAPRARAACVFVSASALSALCGAVVSHHWAGDDMLWASGVAAACGVVFHPLINSIVERVPAWIRAGAAKAGLERD